jgi:hypothetical protein
MDDVSQHPKINFNIFNGILTSPLGKKSKPTIDSNTDDFPADYVPSTQIRGNLIYYCRPTSLSSSITPINLRSC